MKNHSLKFSPDCSGYDAKWFGICSGCNLAAFERKAGRVYL